MNARSSSNTCARVRRFNADFVGRRRIPVHDSTGVGCADGDVATTVCTAAALVFTTVVGASGASSADGSAMASVATTVVAASAVVVLAAATLAAVVVVEGVREVRAVVAVSSPLVAWWARLASAWLCGDSSGDWTRTRSGPEGHAPSEGYSRCCCLTKSIWYRGP